MRIISLRPLRTNSSGKKPRLPTNSPNTSLCLAAMRVLLFRLKAGGQCKQPPDVKNEHASEQDLRLARSPLKFTPNKHSEERGNQRICLADRIRQCDTDQARRHKGEGCAKPPKESAEQPGRMLFRRSLTVVLKCQGRALN